jgi:hypothetical protein
MMGNSGMIGGNFGGAWVIGKVENELTYGGYLRRTTEGARFTGRTIHLIVDCERIQALAEECAGAVDSWHQAWAADPQLKDALFAMPPKPWSHPRVAAADAGFIEAERDLPMLSCAIHAWVL